MHLDRWVLRREELTQLRAAVIARSGRLILLFSEGCNWRVGRSRVIRFDIKAGGDVALSVLMTMSTTLLCIVATPLIAGPLA